MSEVLTSEVLTSAVLTSEVLTSGAVARREWWQSGLTERSVPRPVRRGGP
jgi:hypothetical protein